MHQIPIRVQVLGVNQGAPAQFFDRFFHRVKGIQRSCQQAIFDQRVKIIRQGALLDIHLHQPVANPSGG